MPIWNKKEAKPARPPPPPSYSYDELIDHRLPGYFEVINEKCMFIFVDFFFFNLIIYNLLL